MNELQTLPCRIFLTLSICLYPQQIENKIIVLFYILQLLTLIYFYDKFFLVHCRPPEMCYQLQALCRRSMSLGLLLWNWSPPDFYSISTIYILPFIINLDLNFPLNQKCFDSLVKRRLSILIITKIFKCRIRSFSLRYF